MVIVYSATKGLAAMTLPSPTRGDGSTTRSASARTGRSSRSRARSASPSASCWRTRPDLFALDQPVDRSLVADLDRLAMVLARQKPAWEPGTRQAYHAITLGFYESELLRRVDPQHRSLGQFFHDEIATPLGLDVYIRLPETIPNSRLATIASPRRSRCSWLSGLASARRDESPLQYRSGAQGLRVAAR